MSLEGYLFEIQATITGGRTRTAPNRTGPDQLLFTWNRLDPVQLFTWHRFGIGPERFLNRSKPSPAKKPFQCLIRWDLFWTGFRTVLCEQKAYLIRFSSLKMDPFRTRLEPYWWLVTVLNTAPSSLSFIQCLLGTSEEQFRSTSPLRISDFLKMKRVGGLLPPWL